MRPVTARGFRDVLPLEASEREFVRDAARAVFSAWGYDPVETPVLEVSETLEAASGRLEGTAFRLLDAGGRLLAMRPDMTLPIARMVSARMPGGDGVWRLRYDAEVFRENESLRGQSRQFTQLGVEMVGASGPAADAEIVLLLAETLTACGLRGFTVAIGDVEVFSAIVGEAGMPPEWGASVLRAAHERNLVEIDRLSVEPGVAEKVGAALRSVIRISGGAEAIVACREALAGLGLSDVLGPLAQTWSLVEGRAAGRVAVDFGTMRDFDYYTGLVLEVYAPGIGLPIGGGGRYDSVLGRYGRPAPAVGFALGLERITIALAEAGDLPAVEGVAALVGGDPDAAFAEAARRRASGQRVALAPGVSGDALRRAAESMGAEAVEVR